MTKLIALGLLSALAFTIPAHAATTSDVVSDEVAIQKDNAQIVKHKAHLSKHRMEKAKAKASGDLVGQASSSMAIGADRVMGTEKDAEKSVDQTIKNEDSK